MSEDELLQRITINLQIFGGKPIIRGRRLAVDWPSIGRRLAVEHVMGMFAAGDSPTTILGHGNARGLVSRT